MKLPNGQDARVDLTKVGEYLLADEHPTGSAKAAFFRSLGFVDSFAGLLCVALTDIARNGRVTSIRASTFGTKYVVDGTITGLRGVQARVRTVWIAEHGEAAPRLVTAYPAGDTEQEGADDEGT